MHRDIKPENILLCVDKKVRTRWGWGVPVGSHVDRVEQTNKETIKIADFGWSVVEREHSTRSTMCGTLAYLPPEMVKGTTYNKAVDYWTVGVLMYVPTSFGLSSSSRNIRIKAECFVAPQP